MEAHKRGMPVFRVDPYYVLSTIVYCSRCNFANHQIFHPGAIFAIIKFANPGMCHIT